MTKSELLQIAKPILFNSDMVQAIFNGKTATRRICKDGNAFTVPDMSFYDGQKRTYAVHNYADKDHTEKLSLAERVCPICIGDILYVRETWAVRTAHRFDASANIMFKAGGQESILTFPNAGSDSVNRDEYDNFLRKWDKEGKWNPSIFMPKEAARIFLQVLDVQVQHLQGMTLDDFYEEGVVGSEAYNEPENAYRQAQRIFAEKIWNKTLKEKSDRELYSWDANPWVWAISFKRVYPEDMEG